MRLNECIIIKPNFASLFFNHLHKKSLIIATFTEGIYLLPFQKDANICTKGPQYTRQCGPRWPLVLAVRLFDTGTI